MSNETQKGFVILQTTHENLKSVLTLIKSTLEGKDILIPKIAGDWLQFLEDETVFSPCNVSLTPPQDTKKPIGKTKKPLGAEDGLEKKVINKVSNKIKK